MTKLETRIERFNLKRFRSKPQFRGIWDQVRDELGIPDWEMYSLINKKDESFFKRLFHLIDERTTEVSKIVRNLKHIDLRKNPYRGLFRELARERGCSRIRVITRYNEQDYKALVDVYEKVKARRENGINGYAVIPGVENENASLIMQKIINDYQITKDIFENAVDAGEPKMLEIIGSLNERICISNTVN